MPFEIGLSCSGGVSAGAYIAGVLDFLFQALDEWEAAKDRGDPGVPRHDVTVKVLTGASAGALSAAVGALALARHDSPRPFASPPPAGMQVHQAWLPLLYQTWVVWPRLSAPAQVDPDVAAMQDPPVPAGLHHLDFLSSGDLTSAFGKHNLAVSVLDCQLLNYIAARAVQPLSQPVRRRAWLPQTLDLYLTTTNNRGIPYAVALKNGDYPMVSHADRAHYRITGLGLAQTHSAYGERDPAQILPIAGLEGAPLTDLPVESLLLPAGTPWADWYRFGNTILASAAFPGGLAPRFITADRQDYIGRLFPEMSLRSPLVQPTFPLPVEDANYIASDGGVIDNDPIEYAIATLPASDGADSPTDPAQVTQAVIMIAPFPEAPVYPASCSQTQDILGVMREIQNSLRQQVRFKPSLLLEAADDRLGNRFLISPRRMGPDGTPAKYPLASGALGGFGGFIHRVYRDHDFQLGRRNCQKFLRDSFMLAGRNPLFEAAAEGPDRCVIPLCGSARDPVPEPVWGKITQAEFEALTKRIGSRVGYLRGNLFQNIIKNWLARLALRFLLWLPLFFLQPVLIATVAKSIRGGLASRDQI